MTNISKAELAVAALRNGTVIDHIPSEVLFKAVKILGIEHVRSAVTIGNNLESKKLGHKGIIKVADVYFPEATLNRIALIGEFRCAPQFMGGRPEQEKSCKIFVCQELAPRGSDKSGAFRRGWECDCRQADIHRTWFGETACGSIV